MSGDGGRLPVGQRVKSRWRGRRTRAQRRAAVLTFLQDHALDTAAVDTAAVDVQGVAVTDVAANPYRSGPVETRFINLFTGLTQLKPAMLAEATANGRRAAEQFAADSRSKVGGIRHASQGVFQILPHDPAPGVMAASQPHKTVRVVSTIQYYLED